MQYLQNSNLKWLEPTRVNHLSGAPPYGRLLALTTNKRLGYKGLPKDKNLWQNMSSLEQILRHQWNCRIWDPPNLIDSLFVLLICIAKNTQVSIFTNCTHGISMPFLFLSYAPSFTLLIRCSLSLSPSLTSYSSLGFHLLWFHRNTLMILWDGIIE